MDNLKEQLNEIEQKKQDALREQYGTWVSHPLTQHLLYRIEGQIAKVMLQAASESFDTKVDDKQFRLYAYNIKTLSTVSKIITNQEHFIKES